MRNKGRKKREREIKSMRLQDQYKTKIMLISKFYNKWLYNWSEVVDLEVDGVHLEQVNHFCYRLGSWLHNIK